MIDDLLPAVRTLSFKQNNFTLSLLFGSISGGLLVKISILKSKDKVENPDEHWKLWVKIVTEVALRFFAEVPKSQKDTAETRLEVLRRKLVGQRAELRDEIGSMGKEYGDLLEEEHCDLVQSIRRITRQLRSIERRRRAERRRLLEWDLEEALKRNDQADVHTIAHLIAGKAMGVKRRRYCKLPSFRPNKEELKAYLELHGNEGGMGGMSIDIKGEEKVEGRGNKNWAQ